MLLVILNGHHQIFITTRYALRLTHPLTAATCSKDYYAASGKNVCLL